MRPTFRQAVYDVIDGEFVVAVLQWTKSPLYSYWDISAATRSHLGMHMRHATHEKSQTNKKSVIDDPNKDVGTALSLLVMASQLYKYGASLTRNTNS